MYLYTCEEHSSQSARAQSSCCLNFTSVFSFDKVNSSLNLVNLPVNLTLPEKLELISKPSNSVDVVVLDSRLQGLVKQMKLNTYKWLIRLDI